MKFLSKKKKIIDVHIGDLVLSCDINKKKDEYRKVLNVMRPIVPHEHQVRITTASGSLTTSDIHPTAIFNAEKNIVYVPGKDVSTNDSVVSVNCIDTVVIHTDHPGKSTQYADFSVDQHENYYAGDTPDHLLLAHNSATVFYPIWHYQFEDLIVLKNNQGTEENRVRHMDYGVVMSAFFWKRFKAQKNISLFDPNDVPDLYEAFYTDIDLFEKLYIKYEKDDSIKKKVISADEIIRSGVVKERTDTGRIYIVNIDNVMAQGPFDPKVHTIYQSNLCVEEQQSVTLFNPNLGIFETKISLVPAICEQHGPTFIQSYNHEYEINEFALIDAAAQTSDNAELLEIEDDNGHIVICTPDHSIFTQNRGYVKAKNLIETDILQVGSSISINRSTASNHENLQSLQVD